MEWSKDGVRRHSFAAMRGINFDPECGGHGIESASGESKHHACFCRRSTEALARAVEAAAALDKAVRAADSEEEEASVVAEASVAEEASVVAEVSSNERFRFPKRDSL